MIVTRTPLRISLFGGGTDIPAYFNKHGGAVLSFATKLYMYILMNPRFDSTVRLGYSVTEEVDNVYALQHTLARECLLSAGIETGIEVVSVADVPQGTGLGSSSSYAVGLIHASKHCMHIEHTNEDLAREACVIEIDKLHKPIGCQDQYAAALGGMNVIEFSKTGIKHRAVTVDTTKLLDSMLLVYTGRSRSADIVLKDQQERVVEHDKAALKTLASMKKLVYMAEQYLDDLDVLGEMLNEEWRLKRTLSHQITVDSVNHIYDTGLKNGAIGGKLLGAGGGGFVLFVSKDRPKLEEVFKDHKLLYPRLDTEGSVVLYETNNDTCSRARYTIS
jgi:D-glycero-alpha-D-manno-heptose-7-phosphate kinase